MLKIKKPLVSVDYLKNNFFNENLIILDCTIPKVTANKVDVNVLKKQKIKGAVFFDIKNKFSDVNASFSNTVLSAKNFEIQAQNLGINNESVIICYDDLGVYSSPRVWWMFHLMGFKNIAVLNGGFPDWISKGYPIESSQKQVLSKGNFTANFQSKKIKYTKDVLTTINYENNIVLDARSEGRFFATEPEPRKSVKGGHIPNSKSFPFTEILVDGKMISEEKLQKKFLKINPNKKEMIFSCGTGITASVLALGAELSNYINYAVYDGSWTEWASTAGLPIEK